jgi:hypothetical protein
MNSIPGIGWGHLDEVGIADSRFHIIELHAAGLKGVFHSISKVFKITHGRPTLSGGKTSHDYLY